MGQIEHCHLCMEGSLDFTLTVLLEKKPRLFVTAKSCTFLQQETNKSYQI